MTCTHIRSETVPCVEGRDVVVEVFSCVGDGEGRLAYAWEQSSADQRGESDIVIVLGGPRIRGARDAVAAAEEEAELERHA